MGNQPGRLRIVIDVPRTLADPSILDQFSDSLLSHAKVNMSDDEVKITSQLPLHLWGPKSRKEIFALADSPSGRSPQATTTNEIQRKVIRFYDKQDRFYEFTNFSPHSVKYEGKVYPTSEHLFQAFKVPLIILNAVTLSKIP
jgi:hypothetical protein